MAIDLSEISFDTLWQEIRRSLAGLYRETEFYKGITPEKSEKLLEDLFKAAKAIGNEPVPVPQQPSELYKKQWAEYLAGTKKNVERRAIRYLCWEPDIALTPKFVSLLETLKYSISARCIYALGRACHIKWSKEFAGTSTVKKIRELFRSYNGPNHILNKWKDNINSVLGANGTDITGRKMVDLSAAPETFFKGWGIDASSVFARSAVSSACQICKNHIGESRNYNTFFLKDLLPWENWELSIEDFKKEIEATVLHKNIDAVREKFQTFVLGDKRLGDPRQPRNTNWLGVKEEAKKKFISWLSRRDIIFFFEHVLPKGRDPHGRKNFWLQYVNSLVASRPLLCEQDRYSLRAQLQREQIDYGLISGTNSAFILDFGTIVVVEFSRVGACYIYPKDNFRKIVPDLFENKRFSEGSLKRIDLALEKNKIIHWLTVNCDWRDDVSTVLARYGIRKG